jgi:hypothetical protein
MKKSKLTVTFLVEAHLVNQDVTTNFPSNWLCNNLFSYFQVAQPIIFVVSN